MIGFTSYNNPPNTTPTTAQIVASLTAFEKNAILNGFADGISVSALKHSVGISTNVVRHLYHKIEDIEVLCKSIMRGEIIVTEATYDAEGVELTPVVYNTPPTTLIELKSEVVDEFSEDFTAGQVGAVIDKMIEYSKWDHTGDWDWYKLKVIE